MPLSPTILSSWCRRWDLQLNAAGQPAPLVAAMPAQTAAQFRCNQIAPAPASLVMVRRMKVPPAITAMPAMCKQRSGSGEVLRNWLRISGKWLST